MKILQVINCFARGGGAEKFTFDLSLALKNRGNNVEVLSLIRPASREFLEKTTAQGIKVHILSDGSVYSLKNIVKLRCFFKEHSYDVVQVHLFPVLYFCAVGKLRGMKMVFTEHSTDNRRRHYKILRMIDRYIYRRYDKIICISEKVQELLVKHAGKINSIVIPNGINLNNFLNAEPLNWNEISACSEGVRLVVMTARFAKGKDYLTLFRALKIMPDNVHVVCVGTGELEPGCQKFCKENGLSDRVHFLGLRKDVNRILKMAEVVVLSTEHEGFSLSMLEAMASGNPFIASDVPGITDLIKDYTDLFPFGNEKILANYIMRLLNDDVYRKEIVQKNQLFVRRYDISSTAEKYMKLYMQLIK